MTTKWFRRSDGILFAATEGSASFDHIKALGSFVECDEEGNDIDPFIESLIGNRDESDGNSESSVSEQLQTTADAESGSSAVGGGAGDEDQGNDASGHEEGSAIGQNLSEKSDNPKSVKETSSGSKEKKGK